MFVTNFVEFRAVFALPLLPNHPRLECRVSGLVHGLILFLYAFLNICEGFCLLASLLIFPMVNLSNCRFIYQGDCETLQKNEQKTSSYFLQQPQSADVL